MPGDPLPAILGLGLGRCVAFSLLLAASAAAQHQEADWVYGGTLDVGDVSSEDRHAYRVEGTAEGISARLPDRGTEVLDSGRRLEGRESFLVELPRSRWGPFDADLVVARRFDTADLARMTAEVRVYLDGSEIAPWRFAFHAEPRRFVEALYAIPRELLRTSEGKPKDRVRLAFEGNRALRSYRYRFYATRDGDFLGKSFAGGLHPPTGASKPGECYQAALVLLFEGRDEDAKRWFERAVEASGNDPSLADLARASRRWLRLLRLRAAPPSPDPAARYDRGLFAAANGFREEALEEFAAAAALAPDEPDAAYRHAEAMEYAGRPIEEVASEFRRAADLYEGPSNPWDAMVAIWREGKNEKGDRGRMSEADFAKIYREWGIVEAMVAAASRGALRLRTTFAVVDRLEDATTTRHFFLEGPTSDFLGPRGAFDGVLWFHPFGGSSTGGADTGPSGACFTDIGTWCGWEVYLHEWNHQFDWTSIVSEVGFGYPVTHDSDGCGLQPIPTMGSGHRSSMRYYYTPAMYRRLQAAEPMTEGYLRRWLVAGPLPGDLGAETPIDERTAAPREGERAGESHWSVVEDEGVWIDLEERMPAEREPSIGYAFTWIHVSEETEARLWLGHNDAMRVFLDGRVVHEGRYFAQAGWEDRDLPDMVCATVRLTPGAHRLLLKVERRGGGWGFSVRATDLANRPLTLRPSFEPRASVASDSLPKAGPLHRWGEVEDDWTTRLPRLSVEDLRTITGLDDLEVEGRLFFRSLELANPESNRRAEPRPPDRTLDNFLDWERELVAVLRAPDASRAGAHRDFLFLRPEAIEIFLRLLPTPPGEPAPRDAVLGFLHVGDRNVLALRARLGALPIDAEDLLVVRGLPR